jgi:DNA end-binding protein Ku
MTARPVWKGFIQFSLVSIPVKTYTAAATGGGGIALNQLHKECNSRIQYKKVCPLHGEVPADQIVSGYEFAEGQYVVVDPGEIDKLRPKNEKTIGIEAFIPRDSLDPRYFSGRTQYVVPDGPIGFKAYALLHRALVQERRYAFAQVVLHGHRQAVALRPIENLLAMSFLNYAEDVKSPSMFATEAPAAEVSPDELKLAKTLVDALSPKEFDFAEYTDDYSEKLRELIEAKVHGKQIVSPPAEEPPAQVANLMEALQRSVAAAQQKKAASGAKPPKLVAPPTGGAPVAASAKTRRRKTS